MKRHFTHLVTALLAGASLVVASCSDSGTDEPKHPQPNFPAPISATVAAGDTYSFTIEPNQDWLLELPTSLSAWYWIQDGTQKVYSKRGTQGKYEITIGVSEQEEFDQARVCEVTMTMGGKKETVVTLTRGTLERGLSLYPGKINPEDGLFEFDEEGKYAYEEQPATSFELAWPQGQTGFSRPVMVQANFDWAIGDMPQWLLPPTVATGTAGTEVELRCIGDVVNYPLDGGTGKLVFIDQSNHDARYEFEISIPPCRDKFEVSFDNELVEEREELKFDENANFWSEKNGLWLPGEIIGSYLSIKGTKLYIFSEVTEADGSTHLSATADDTEWVNLTEAPWNDAREGGVTQTVPFTIGVTANDGDARKGYLVVLPPAVAQQVSDPAQLVSGGFKPEYEQYVFGTITQKPLPGTIQPLSPNDLTSVGAMFEKLHSTNKLIKDYGVADAYRLTYTRDWSNDPTSTLVFSKEFTEYTCYDTNGNAIPDAGNWLSVTRADKGWIVNMTAENRGVIVFEDAEGKAFAALECIYDTKAVIEQVKVEFVYPDLVEGAELKEITSGKYFEQYKDLGVPIWNLTYTSKKTYTTTIRVPAHAKTISDSKWLKSEDGSDNEFIVHMNSETAAEGVLLLQTVGGHTVMVLVCTLAI